MIFLRNSSPVIGDENMPNVPSVAPRWPSADVVAQQSVSVIVLKPARNCDSGRGKNGRAARKQRENACVRRAHLSHCATVRRCLAARSAPRLVRSRRLKLVLNQDQGCLFCIELAPALGFRGLEGAVGLRTRQTHRRFWSVVMTERRMIPGFLSLRKGKPDLTAAAPNAKTYPVDGICQQEVHKRGKLVRGRKKTTHAATATSSPSP